MSKLTWCAQSVEFPFHPSEIYAHADSSWANVVPHVKAHSAILLESHACFCPCNVYSRSRTHKAIAENDILHGDLNTLTFAGVFFITILTVVSLRSKQSSATYMVIPVVALLVDYCSFWMFVVWIRFTSISFRLFSISVFDFTHLLHGARGVDNQTDSMCALVNKNCQFCQFSFSQFYCFIRYHSSRFNSSVHPLTSSIFCLLYFWHSRFMATYKLSWLFLRSLERG